MKSRSFVLSAIILALGGFFAKAIGALYKIPLTNILGSSGIGLYYLIFPIYSLFITFCSSGINVALATEVAKCRKVRHRYNEQKLLRASLYISFLLSLVFTIITLIISSPVAEIQGNINARLGYVAIAPAIIISSIIATLRGYFQGVENMVPTTVSMIVEQVVKLSFGLILAHKLCNFGVQYAVLGAVIGVTISEVVALIIISINFFSFRGQLYYNYRNKYYRAKKNIIIKQKTQRILKGCNQHQLQKIRYICNNKKDKFTTKEAIKRIMKVFAPATLSSVVLPLVTMLDSFLLINLLVNSGLSSVVSTSLYGIWGGVVQTIISLPTIVIAGVSTAIVPSLSGVVAGQSVAQVNKRVMFFIKITLVLAIFMFTVVFVFSRDILYFLYGNGLNSSVFDELSYATKMLQMSSISIIYYALLQTFTSILQAIGKSYVPLVSMFVGLVVRVILTIVLVSVLDINIFGAIIANCAFLGATIVILAWYIRNKVKLDYNLLQELVLPVLIGGVVLVGMWLLHKGLILIINYFWSMVISVVIWVSIYLIWVFFSRVFTRKEKNDFFIKCTKKLKINSKTCQKGQKNP